MSYELGFVLISVFSEIKINIKSVLEFFSNADFFLNRKGHKELR
jgi:hypothetical protein